MYEKEVDQCAGRFVLSKKQTNGQGPGAFSLRRITFDSKARPSIFENAPGRSSVNPSPTQSTRRSQRMLLYLDERTRAREVHGILRWSCATGVCWKIIYSQEDGNNTATAAAAAMTRLLEMWWIATNKRPVWCEMKMDKQRSFRGELQGRGAESKK